MCCPAPPALIPTGTDDMGVADDEAPDDPEELPEDEILMVRTFFLATGPDGDPDNDPDPGRGRGRGRAMLLGSRLWEVGETRGRGEERGTEVSEMREGVATLGPECLTERWPGGLGGLVVPLPFSFLTLALTLTTVAGTVLADEGIAGEGEMGNIGRGAPKPDEDEEEEEEGGGIARVVSAKGSKDKKLSSLRISVERPEGDWAGEYTLYEGDSFGEGTYNPDGDDGPDPDPIDLGDAGDAGLIALPGLEWAG